MSQQALDLRRSVQVVRRHRILVGIVVALGLLVGGGYAATHRPLLTSTALVVLPQSTSASQLQPSGTSTVSPYTATQMVIAGSNRVLSAALPNVKPTMSLDKLRSEVRVASVTAYIISISAQGKTAADAEATATAVAASYIAYVNSPSSPIGHVSARLLQPASTAAGTAPLQALVVTGLVGILAGAVIGVVVSLAISRKDRRLRERDEIANSIGIPVLASVPAAHPSDAAGWRRLLEEYKPAAVHAWRLRTALQQLGATSQAGHDGDGTSLLVLSLSSDPGALALGPQLAVFAASQGIPTSLVIGQQQDAAITATLRTACAASPSVSALLNVMVVDEGNVSSQLPPSALVVVVAVVDGSAPKMPDTMRTGTTVIGVSAGAATAEQLARAAVVAAADGREVAGILVANPETTDRTTGRIPQLARPAPRKQPRRLRGIVTEIRR